MFKKMLIAIGLVVLMASQSFATYAPVSLSVVPSTQDVIMGETAYVDVVLSGLTEAPGLTEFFIEIIDYNDLVLDFNESLSSFHVTANGAYFAQQGGDNVQAFVEGQDGIISPDPQPFPYFTLVTLAFDTLEIGSSDLTLNTALYIYPGSPDVTIENFNDGSINVVPVPGALWLLGSSLLGFVGLCKRNKV